MITVVLPAGIPGGSHPDLKTLHIRPCHLLLKAELIASSVQMDIIGTRLSPARQNLNPGIRLIVAHHRHRHGIQIALIQISRQFHILHVDILPFFRLIDIGEKLHLPRKQRRRHAPEIPLRLLPVRQDDYPSGSLRRNHGKRPRKGILKICGSLIRHRHHLCKMILPCQKLLHKRILPESHNTILIVLRHPAKRRFQIMLHSGKVLLVAVRYIQQKNSRIDSVPPVYGHAEQRQQKNTHTGGAHDQIKSAPIPHLPHIQHPFRYHQDERQHEQHIAQPHPHKLTAVGGFGNRSLRRDPTIRLLLCGKAHHILFRQFPRRHLIQPCLFCLRMQCTHIKIRQRMEQQRIPCLIDIFRKK